MGFFVKLAEGKYIEWSGVCDAPSSGVMTLDSVKESIYEIERRRYARQELDDLGEVGDAVRNCVSRCAEARLSRLEKNGTTSMVGGTLESLLGFNRAGPKETHIKTVDALIETYTWTPEKKDQWPFK